MVGRTSYLLPLGTGAQKTLSVKTKTKVALSLSVLLTSYVSKLPIVSLWLPMYLQKPLWLFTSLTSFISIWLWTFYLCMPGQCLWSDVSLWLRTHLLFWYITIRFRSVTIVTKLVLYVVVCSAASLLPCQFVKTFFEGYLSSLIHIGSSFLHLQSNIFYYDS